MNHIGIAMLRTRSALSAARWLGAATALCTTVRASDSSPAPASAIKMPSCTRSMQASSMLTPTPRLGAGDAWRNSAAGPSRT